MDTLEPHGRPLSIITESVNPSSAPTPISSPARAKGHVREGHEPATMRSDGSSPPSMLPRRVAAHASSVPHVSTASSKAVVAPTARASSSTVAAAIATPAVQKSSKADAFVEGPGRPSSVPVKEGVQRSSSGRRKSVPPLNTHDTNGVARLAAPSEPVKSPSVDLDMTAPSGAPRPRSALARTMSPRNALSFHLDTRSATPQGVNRPVSAGGHRLPRRNGDRPLSFHGPHQGFTVHRGGLIAEDPPFPMLKRGNSADSRQGREEACANMTPSPRPFSMHRQTSAPPILELDDPQPKRQSLRIPSLLSRFGQDAARRLTKSPTPSPLSAISILPEDDDLHSDSPVRTAIRTSGTFGIRDDGSETISFIGHESNVHRRSSCGSIVEVTVRRLLYAENADDLSDDGTSDSRHSPARNPGVLNAATDNARRRRALELNPAELPARRESLRIIPTPSAHSRSASLERSSPMLEMPPLASPCSTNYPNPPEDSQEVLLLVASHMLSTHAATLMRHAETMNEISGTMRAMASESLDWGSRLMGMAGGNGDLPTLHESHLEGPSDRPLQHRAQSDSAVSSRPHARSRSEGFTTLPPRPTISRQKSQRGTRAVSPPVIDPKVLIAQAERLGRQGWENLRAAEDVWTLAMSELRNMSGGSSPLTTERSSSLATHPTRSSSLRTSESVFTRDSVSVGTADFTQTRHASLGLSDSAPTQPASSSEVVSPPVQQAAKELPERHISGSDGPLLTPVPELDQQLEYIDPSDPVFDSILTNESSLVIVPSPEAKSPVLTQSPQRQDSTPSSSGCGSPSRHTFFSANASPERKSNGNHSESQPASPSKMASKKNVAELGSTPETPDIGTMLAASLELLTPASSWLVDSSGELLRTPSSESLHWASPSSSEDNGAVLVTPPFRADDSELLHVTPPRGMSSKRGGSPQSIHGVSARSPPKPLLRRGSADDAPTAAVPGRRQPSGAVEIQSRNASEPRRPPSAWGGPPVLDTNASDTIEKQAKGTPPLTHSGSATLGPSQGLRRKLSMRRASVNPSPTPSSPAKKRWFSLKWAGTPTY